MKISAFAHPFLFTIASLIYLFFISSVIASPDQVIRVFALFGGILLAGIFPAYWLTRDWNWAGVLLSVIAISFFTSPVFFKAEITTVVAAVICWGAFCFIKRRPLRSQQLVTVLNLTSLTLVIVVGGGVLKQASSISFFDTPHYNWKNRTLPMELATTNEKPDIYYIVFDGYGRADVLTEYYDYDNSEFIGNLRAKGFVIPSESRSNYPKTMLSIPSTLNMDYISVLTPELHDKDTYYWWLMTPLIDNSDVRLMLEEIGYRSYSITTGWGPTDNPETDVHYKPALWVFSDFESMVFSATPMRIFSPLLSNLAYIPSFDGHRNLILYNFSTLSEISREGGPKFVFAHIISPHPPFVFGENGEPLTPNYNYSFNDANDMMLTSEEYRDGYIKQLAFLNKQIVELVDQILINSKIPPIIILQADHGPGMYTDFGSLENTCLKERFSIFAAYHLPHTKTDVIPEAITPVNVFRIIFNEYFGADFEQLPRRHYYYDDTIFLFHGDDVTSMVDTCSDGR